MAKDINLTSQQWNDIIFEGKNKGYGAYEMRQSSSKRHIIAFLSTLALAIFVAIIPALASVITDVINSRTKSLDDIVEIKDVDLKKPEDEIKDMIEEISIPDPVLSTLAFVAPDIADEVNPEDELKTMEELAESKSVISVANVDGSTTDPNIGIDIAELDRNKKIIEDNDKKIWKFVEQMPEFPGGAGELHKFLSDKIVYPKQARELTIEGIVTVNFIVEKDGKIGDIKINRSPHILLSNEAIRVVKLMPPWIVGKQNGTPVRVSFTLPINFQLH
jgi:protein TonB